MKVVVTGATGNVGTALLARLSRDEGIDEVVGIARRVPLAPPAARTRFVGADVAADALVPLFEGADAVVHLAWAIQPSHDPRALRRTNVTGTERVIAAIAEAGVPRLVVASSVGAYSRGPADGHAVDESWPARGIPSSFYSRHKGECERLLDEFEARGAATRVTRLRPGLTFSRRAASGVRRLFLGGLIPRAALSPRRIPLVPAIPGLRFQAVHSDDVAEAYHRALVRDVSGAFNIAADPVLEPTVLGRALGARVVPVARPVARAVIAASWHARLQPTPAGWLDMALEVPVMDTSRARAELGWAPVVSSTDALREILTGMREGAGAPTPPLRPAGARR